jgi:hypothetical protein
VLSILLVVLLSGAVLWVVAGDGGKPTSAGDAPIATEDDPVVEVVPEPDIEPEPEVVVPARPPRLPATSRRRPLLAAPPDPEPEPVAVAAMVVERPPPVTARMAGAPLPRHRARSGVLLVLLVVVVGLLVAAVIGAVLAALAFALRAAVTS